MVLPRLRFYGRILSSQSQGELFLAQQARKNAKGRYRRNIPPGKIDGFFADTPRSAA
jgi:hypothetical protein